MTRRTTDPAAATIAIAKRRSDIAIGLAFALPALVSALSLALGG